MSGRFLEEGAIAYRPAKDTSIRTRVSKKHARNRDLEVVFDPSDHKEYLTGFHKRKQQRRKDALKQLEKRQKFQRIEDRSEKREAFKKQLGLEDQNLHKNNNNNNDDDDDDDKEPEVQVFDAGKLVSTVTVCPLKTGDTSSEEEEDNDGSDDKKGDKKQYPEPVAKHQYKKMTKGALRALTKTSIKLGKVKKQPYANRKNPAAAAAASRRGGGSGGDSGGRGGRRGGGGGGGGGGRRR